MNRKISLLILMTFCFGMQAYSVDPKKGKQIPDIPGYHTLKCDFHMHTVFSDGKVWPTVRVEEAISEGLDAIALTDHIRKEKPGSDVSNNLDRAFEIAQRALGDRDLILIKGGEITHKMPPGHFNALFLTEVQKVSSEDSQLAFKEARRQNAFIFWNHPNWRGRNSKWDMDGISVWFDEHTKLFEDGTMMGIEVVNGFSYNREAHQWCIEKNLTMMANSDIHQPISFEYDSEKNHRPLTLVFAKERSAESIKEALLERRTAVWFENNLIGNEEFLAPIFNESVSIENVVYHDKIAEVVLSNSSSVDFILENTGEYSFYNKTRIMILKAGESLRLGVKTGDVLDEFKLKFNVLNLLVTPDEPLEIELACRKTD